MGDHFVLMVNRLLTESNLEAAIQHGNQLNLAKTSVNKDCVTDCSLEGMDLSFRSSPGKLVQCRICHDEDEDTNMEVPCSCCGSLKHAHRHCVQRWCNEKGDTICEICHQQFKPDYIAPAPLFHYGSLSLNFRANWEIPRRDLHNTQYITTVTDDHEFVDSDFDEYSAPSSRSLICCRVVAIIFMVLLVLRHTLPILISGAGDYSLTLFTLLMLRTIGILLPIYVMVKAFTAIQHRHHRQDSHLPLVSSDEEDELPQFHHHSRVIHIH